MKKWTFFPTFFFLFSFLLSIQLVLFRERKMKNSLFLYILALDFTLLQLSINVLGVWEMYIKTPFSDFIRLCLNEIRQQPQVPWATEHESAWKINVRQIAHSCTLFVWNEVWNIKKTTRAGEYAWLRSEGNLVIAILTPRSIRIHTHWRINVEHVSRVSIEAKLIYEP